MELSHIRFTTAAVFAATLALASTASAAPITGIPGSWDGVYIAPHTGSSMLGWGFDRYTQGPNLPPPGGNKTPPGFGNNPGADFGNGPGNNPDNNPGPGDGNSGSQFAGNGGTNPPGYEPPGSGPNDGGPNNGGPNDVSTFDEISILAEDPPAAVAVPEPFTLSIFGAGLVGAAVSRRRRKKPA